MIRLIVGPNGGGKTLYLKKTYNRLSNTFGFNSIVTNLNTPHTPHTEIDYNRFNLLTSSTNDEVWDYNTLRIDNTSIVIELTGTPIRYSNYFLTLVNLLCQTGQYLILDQPEFGLRGDELNSFNTLLRCIRHTYTDIYIATHNQRLFSLADRYYWAQSLLIKEVTERDVYNHIGSLRH